MKFKKTLLAASLAAMSMGAIAQSQDASKDLPETAASTDWAATANVNIVSDYRFRGIDQTFNQPALQGGFDLSMPYGFYIGNWNSNVNQSLYSGSNLEMDLYGGWKYAFTEDLGLDTGVINYFYPGSKVVEIRGDDVGGGFSSGMVYNLEYYIGGTWKTVSLKQFFALTDYFNAKGLNNASTAGSGYTDLTATYDLGNLEPMLAGWGLVAHAGYFYQKNYSVANYADWKLGITKDLGDGWNASVSYIQTSAAGNCGASTTQPYCYTNSTGSTQNAGNATGIVSIGKTF